MQALVTYNEMKLTKYKEYSIGKNSGMVINRTQGSNLMKHSNSHNDSIKSFQEK